MDRVQSRLQRLSMVVDGVRIRLTPRPGRSRSGSRRRTATPDDWRFLRRPALLGFIAIVSICVGASLPGSPFKFEAPGTWFFGERASASERPFLLLPGVVAVYGGMILFIRVWFGLVQTLRHRPGAPIRTLAWMLALWIVPLLVVAPLFSRDVYSYAAQGEMMSHHINPYYYGRATIGSGPVRDRGRATVVEHPGPLRAVLLDAGRVGGFPRAATTRWSPSCCCACMSVAGVALIAYCIPKLARAYGRDPGRRSRWRC